MRNIFSWIGLALVLAVIGRLNVPVARAEQVDEIVASVDGEPITMHEVRAYAEASGRTISDRDPTSDPTFKEGLKGLIAEKLLNDETRKYEDKVEEDQIDKYIEDVERERNISDQQLRESLLQNGISYEDFRKQAKMELEKGMMLNEELRQHVTIPQEEIQAYYDAHHDQFTVKQEKYRLAQILVSVAPNASQGEVATAREKIIEVRKKAIAGEDFAELAKHYSDDDSKAQGGELGVFAPDDIMDEILTAIKNVPPGGISDVVRTKHGFHLIKVEQHEVPGLKPLIVVKEDIRNKLVDQQIRSRLNNWVETDLVKQHDVETLY
ncbi:MAG TPA: peptidylprolyl isomerase [Candidatus Binataceae bacterium]|nr:peptidylprolyl isomerase [Candidatus Binataceae bacterium]